MGGVSRHHQLGYVRVRLAVVKAMRVGEYHEA